MSITKEALSKVTYSDIMILIEHGRTYMPTFIELRIRFMYLCTEAHHRRLTYREFEEVKALHSTMSEIHDNYVKIKHAEIKKTEEISRFFSELMRVSVAYLVIGIGLA